MSTSPDREFIVPESLRSAHRDHRRGWIEGLPATAARIQEQWALELGAPFEPGGQAAWVAPARGPDGDDLVVKLARRHPEAEHEAEGLRVWAGDGAVRLRAVEEFDDTTALLLERCDPGTSLSSRPEPEQDTVIAGLLLRLWLEPPPDQPFRPLQTMCDDWADQYESRSPDPALDPGLIRAGIDLFRTLPASADRAVLLCTDLHAGNVLSARREPWLAIDPKPYVGDPTYDVLQHLLNCTERLREDPHGLARRMAELLGLDPSRLLLWLFARCVQESPNWPGLADVAQRIAPD